ncbi:MAG: sensor histidine kinase, partial [Rubricoccaceae bacterium]
MPARARPLAPAVQAYRTSTRLKLGLIVGAVVIAVSSLVFTNRLADRLQAQDEAAVELWARAVEYQSRAAVAPNPFADAWPELDSVVAAARLPAARVQRLREALAWAEEQPSGDALDFVFTEIVEPARFNVPAIITDEAGTSVTGARNVRVDSSAGPEAVQARLLALAAEMDALNPPIRLVYGPGAVQLIHYGESDLARLIRWFPLVQLLFVSLFILVGYLSFSYVRRSEQSSLWVGMAKEAAHQLGTPLSSMIGWIELLRLQDEQGAAAPIADELERDVERLRRVADRFEQIGSLPELEPTPVAAVLHGVADYMRRRLPRSGPAVTLSVEAPDDLVAALNPDLFEWVIENLLKNALDAMPGGGEIRMRAFRQEDCAVIEVADTGKGMDRATARHIFRPGFSTKKRGWGLGLSLARRIVNEYHGGTLALHATRPGAGTTFRIELDALEEPASGAGDAAPASPPAGPPAGRT